MCLFFTLYASTSRIILNFCLPFLSFLHVDNPSSTLNVWCFLVLFSLYSSVWVIWVCCFRSGKDPKWFYFISFHRISVCTTLNPDGSTNVFFFFFPFFLVWLTWTCTKKVWVVYVFFSFLFICTMRGVGPSTTRAYFMCKLFLFFLYTSSRVDSGWSQRSRFWQKCQLAADLQCTGETVAERRMVAGS